MLLALDGLPATHGSRGTGSLFISAGPTAGVPNFWAQMRSRWIWYVLCFALLFEGFRANRWGAADEKFYRNFDRFSQAMLVAAMAYKPQVQADRNVFALGAYNPPGHDMDGAFVVPSERAYLDPQLAATNATLYQEYKSQVGLQGFVITRVDPWLPWDAYGRVRWWRDCTAAAAAATVTLMLAWVRQRFGTAAASVSLLLWLASEWPTAISHNFFNQFWLHYASLIVAGAWLDRGGPWGPAVVAFALAVAARLACGYEFVFNVAVAPLCLLLYHALRARWSRVQFGRGLALVALGSCLGLAMTLSAHLWMLSRTEGSWASAWRYLLYGVVLKRTHPIGGVAIPGEAGSSLQQPLGEVLARYWLDDGPFRWVPGFNFTCLLLVVGVLLLAVWRTAPGNSERRSLIALAVATFCALAGPLGWFVLVKGHAAAHPHIDYIAWYLPFAAFAYAFIGASLTWLIRMQFFRRHQGAELNVGE